jgi:hypothetical protein
VRSSLRRRLAPRPGIPLSVVCLVEPVKSIRTRMVVRDSRVRTRESRSVTSSRRGLVGFMVGVFGGERG